MDRPRLKIQEGVRLMREASVYNQDVLTVCEGS